MRKFSAALLSILIAAAPAVPVPVGAEGDSPFEVLSSSNAAAGWEAVLQKIGVPSGADDPERKILMRRLESLPDIAQKIKKSVTRPIPLAEWGRILSGMGIQPKPAMSPADWTAVLSQAGVEIESLSAESDIAAAAPAAGPDTHPAQAQAESPPSIGAAPVDAPAGLKPKTITLDLRGMDVLEVLKLISRQSGLNMAASPNVRGTVTLFLKDVDLWEAIRLILETNELAYTLDHNVVRVMTGGDYEKLYGIRFDDKTKIEIVPLRCVRAMAAAKFLEPVKSRVGKIIVYDFNNSLILVDTPDSLSKMRTLVLSMDQERESRVFAVNYAKVEEIYSKLSAIGTKEIGELDMDKRTKRIFAADYPDKIRQMEKVLAAFDGQHRTVLIEAKIIQVTLSSKFQMGVQWEHVFNKINGEIIPGNIKGNFNILPLGGLGLAANLGTLAQNNYTGLIQLLETAGKTDLLSAPRITALNNEAAKILVGTKEAYVTTTVVNPGGTSPSTTAENVNFVDVGVKLFVTPDIGEDGFIALKIRPEISSVERTLSTSQGNSIPIIRTSESETSVLAKDGETILIAGLIEDKFERSDSRIPWLGRIPILGFPFRGRTDSKVKTEIVVLLTPKIVSGEKKE